MLYSLKNAAKGCIEITIATKKEHLSRESSSSFTVELNLFLYSDCRPCGGSSSGRDYAPLLFVRSHGQHRFQNGEHQYA